MTFNGVNNFHSIIEEQGIDNNHTNNINNTQQQHSTFRPSPLIPEHLILPSSAHESLNSQNSYENNNTHSQESQHLNKFDSPLTGSERTGTSSSSSVPSPTFNQDTTSFQHVIQDTKNSVEEQHGNDGVITTQKSKKKSSCNKTIKGNGYKKRKSKKEKEEIRLMEQKKKIIFEKQLNNLKFTSKNFQNIQNIVNYYCNTSWEDQRDGLDNKRKELYDTGVKKDKNSFKKDKGRSLQKREANKITADQHRKAEKAVQPSREELSRKSFRDCQMLGRWIQLLMDENLKSAQLDLPIVQQNNVNQMDVVQSQGEMNVESNQLISSGAPSDSLKNMFLDDSTKFNTLPTPNDITQNANNNVNSQYEESNNVSEPNIINESIFNPNISVEKLNPDILGASFDIEDRPMIDGMSSEK